MKQKTPIGSMGWLRCESLEFRTQSQIKGSRRSDSMGKTISMFTGRPIAYTIYGRKHRRTAVMSSSAAVRVSCLIFFAALCGLFGNKQAHAVGISVVCNGSQVLLSAPSGTPFFCAFEGGGFASGTAPPSIAIGGMNSFFDGISIVYNTRQSGDTSVNSIEITADSTPFWTIGPMVPTYLGLHGSADVASPQGSLSIYQSGLLGGPLQQNIHTLNMRLDHTNCHPCTIADDNSSMQLINNHALETLRISSVGRTFFDPSLQPFLGAPLPPAWTMMLTVLGLYVFVAYRRKQVVAAA
jgi:hypothetical protein